MFTRRQFIASGVTGAAFVLSPALSAIQDTQFIPHRLDRYIELPESFFHPFEPFKAMLVYRICGDSPPPQQKSAGLLWFNKLLVVRQYITSFYDNHQAVPIGSHLIRASNCIPSEFVIDFDSHVISVITDRAFGAYSNYPEWVDLGDLRVMP